jgi:hypothetical protein
MWKGEWETTFVMPEDYEDEQEFSKGKKITGAMTVRRILQGQGLLITRTFKNSDGKTILAQKSLACWCPKEEVILLHELSTMGGHTTGVVKMVDGQEQHISTSIDAQGKKTIGRSISRSVSPNENELEIVEGPLAGFKGTWKRRKAAGE